MLPSRFYNRSAPEVAKDLVGKVIRRRHRELWLSAAIVETEAYGSDKGSHSYLGRTPSREARWAPAGTIYMYYSMGGDSLNISVRGDGHAVLIKAARPWLDKHSGMDSIEAMHKLNPGSKTKRKDNKLLAGQALLARALNLKVSEWNEQPFDRSNFYIEDIGYRPNSIIQCRRIGIPRHRDPDLLLRFVDKDHVKSATQNPLTKKEWMEGKDFLLLGLK